MLQDSNCRRKVYLKEPRAQKEDRFRSGRPIVYMINAYLRVTGTHETMLVFANLINVMSSRPTGDLDKLKSGQRQDGREKKTIWTYVGKD